MAVCTPFFFTTVKRDIVLVIKIILTTKTIKNTMAQDASSYVKGRDIDRISSIFQLTDASSNGFSFLSEPMIPCIPLRSSPWFEVKAEILYTCPPKYHGIYDSPGPCIMDADSQYHATLAKENALLKKRLLRDYPTVTPLTKEDVGKIVIKVRPKENFGHLPDCSYIEEKMELLSIQFYEGTIEVKCMECRRIEDQLDFGDLRIKGPDCYGWIVDPNPPQK